MALAIFDLDETLIAVDSDHAFGDYLAAEGLVDASEQRVANERFYRQYQEGRLDIHAYLAHVCGLLARFPMAELLALRQDFVQRRIAPAVLPAGLALIARHRQQGDHPLVITSTLEFIAEPIVKELLGIETLIAPQPELRDGRFTGKALGTPSFGAGKVTRLQEWLAATGHTLAGSHCYTDSHNDLPLLRAVERPVAVDPDPQLRQAAEANAWPIITLRG